MAADGLETLKDLLRELFQFDNADLDFGIYRIMNHKRVEIDRFLDTGLAKIVDDALEGGVEAQRASQASELQEVAQRIRDDVSEDAITPDGELKPDRRDSNIGKRYMELREKAAGAVDMEGLKNSVFNRVYDFFGRYYDNGDFLSKRRYSRQQKYAIPYNGEEVYLHWANADQYYIKSAAHFADYRYKAADGGTVYFKLVAANTEQNNVKGDKRFFVPRIEDAMLDEDTGELTIPFEYRPLKDAEASSYGASKQQENIVEAALRDIPQRFAKNPAALLMLEPADLLRTHLIRYTRRNTSDYFVHKDLKGFLERELDFYLKNEVLDLDNLDVAGPERAEGWFETMRAIKLLGREIIAFLAQIEDFQKKLFEKKKFVVQVDYCLTLDNVPENLYEEVTTNEDQYDEWRDLFKTDEIPANLENGNGDQHSVDWLKANPHLVLDTKFFGEDFKDRLLMGIENLDEKTDGLLINSENFQALNLLQERYREQVKCIYIDPPYNSKTSEILYKNDYKHSSWLSLLENRLREAHVLQHEKSVLVVAIDENEQERLGLLLGKLYPEHSKTCVTVIHNPGGIQGVNFSYSHEYAYFVFPANGKYIGTTQREEADVTPLRDWGGDESKRETARNCFYPIFAKGNIVVGFGDVCTDDFHPEQAVSELEDGATVVYPVDSSGVERKWRFARQSVEKIQDDLVCEEVNGERVIRRYKSEYRYKTVWTDKKYNSNAYGSRLLRDIIGESKFAFPKSVHAVADSIHATTQGIEYPYILDFFAGSGTTGHAVIDLNRKDSGNRKYILIEMGEYFDDVLKKRIQKVIYSKDWKGGKPVSREGTSHIFKYMKLESYEDALENIAFTEEGKGQEALETYGDDYLLRYMLGFETRDSDALLNVEKLVSPFDYKLTLRNGEESHDTVVDLPETFAYLIGLRLASRKTYFDDGRRYLVYRGATAERDDVAVIWRDVKDWQLDDLERDRDFVKESGMAEDAQEVFVNGGDTLIEDARPLEGVFKRLMVSEIA